MNLAFLVMLIFAFPLATPNVEIHAQCILCHGKPGFGIREGDRVRPLWFSYPMFLESVHGGMPCQSCHTDVRIIPHLRKPQKIHCLQCHFEGNVVGAPVTHRPEKYMESVHGTLKGTGKFKAPDCKDCHGVHDVLRLENPQSRVYRTNIPKLCGQCHPTIETEYYDSVHGKALMRNVQDAAVCTHCHREHDILPPEDPRSSLNPVNIVQTCSQCHENVEIAKRIGVPVRQVKSFRESFHGIALAFGLKKAANCTSCHGVHHILPSSDPRSPTNPRRLPETCGKCHPRANENVIKGKIHIIPSERTSGAVYYVYQFYRWAILLTLFGLSVHVVLDLLGHLRYRRTKHKGD